MKSELDLIIRGGTIIDGTGSEPFQGDIAIAGGNFVAVGAVAETARDEIDARGHIVTPGFVDIHTHYDGQAIWSDRLNPSSSHGVTTVVTGNCGIGFAPCHTQDHDTLIQLMEGVEDIPEAVMAQGLPWDWTSFPEFLDALEARPRDIDVAAYLPHSALRLYVMGARGARREVATASDLDRMKCLIEEALAAGALGVGTSSTPVHRSVNGEPIPTYAVSEDELQSIAQAIAAQGRGVFQMVVDVDADIPMEDLVSKLARLAKTSRNTVTFSLVQTDVYPDRWREILNLVQVANNDPNVNIVPQVLPRPIGMFLGFQLSLNPFIFCPTYQNEILKLPPADRVDRLRDHEVRRRLLCEQPADSNLPLFQRARRFHKMFEISTEINYEPLLSESIERRAKRLGLSALEVAYDILLKDNGNAMIYFAMTNYSNGNLDHVLEMLRTPGVLPGLGDGGAHYGLICDASFPTFMLCHWTRDRRGERLELAEAVKALTSAPAAAVGLRDRGLILPGYKADCNVINYEKLTLPPPHVSHDLPGNRMRLNQLATGYKATIVSGVLIARDDTPSGARPGRLVRAQ